MHRDGLLVALGDLVPDLRHRTWLVLPWLLLLLYVLLLMLVDAEVKSAGATLVLATRHQIELTFIIHA